MFLQLHHVKIELLTSFSVDVNAFLGESHDFISSLPLEEFGQCMTSPIEDEVELRRATDNFSIAALKVRHES